MNTSSPILFTCTFLAGFLALGSESLFLKLFDLVLGSAPWVVFVTVATVVLGMGLGAWASVRIRRPWTVFLAIMLIIAWWFFRLDSAARLNADWLHQLIPILGPNAAPALLAFIQMLPLSVLLGLPFPALAELAGNAQTAYWLSSSGALLGLLAMDVLVFPALGVPGGLWLLMAVSGLTALLLIRFRMPEKFATLEKVRLSPRLVLVGAATGGYQSSWLFLSVLLFSPLYYVQITVIAAAVLGLALGTRLWLRFRWTLDELLGIIIYGMLLSWGVTFVALLALPLQFLPIGPGVALLSSVVLLGSTPIGAVFSAAVRDRHDRQTVSSVNLSLAVGNFLGLVLVNLAVRWLAPAWGLAISAAVLLALAVKSPPLPSRQRRVRLVACLLLAVLAWQTTDARLMGLSSVKPAGVRVERVIRGFGELSGVYRMREPLVPLQEQRRLYQTGVSAIDLNRDGEREAGGVSAAYSPRKKRALVIGAGSGKAAGQVALSFERTDIVDISTTQKELLDYLKRENYHLVENPRVRFHQMDGVLAPLVFHEPYDLILLTTSPAYYRQAAKLFTVEYFESLKSLLAPGGVFVYWLDSSQSDAALATLVNTGRRAFDYQKLFSLNQRPTGSPGYFLLIHGAQEPRMNAAGVVLSAASEPGDPRVLAALRDGEAGRGFHFAYDGAEKVNSLYAPRREVLLGMRPRAWP